MFLPDVNLWLALAFESHIHHAAASHWFEGLLNDGCTFCRLTQQGFLRLATNPKAFGAEAVPMADAWRLYDALSAILAFPSRRSPRTSTRSGGATPSAGLFRRRSGTMRSLPPSLEPAVTS